MTPAKLKLNRVFGFSLLLALGFLGGYFWPRPVGVSQRLVVEQVIDGDTLEVKIAGKPERVRLIGVDTPEIAHSSEEKSECFGPEAAQYLQGILEQELIYLVRDPSISERDKYQRLLRYVFLEDGTLVNAKLIEEGYGFLYIYQPFQFMKQFDYFEKEARRQKKGLWSEECFYYFE